ncbi:hypothetical protein HYV89_05770 [Candidatus Woesearchaeota archaeon]|nr:hypothetical protein [Candidatus Woesearchaeota archaeon]
MKPNGFLRGKGGSELVGIKIKMEYGAIRYFFEKTIDYDETLSLINDIKSKKFDNGSNKDGRYIAINIYDPKTYEPLFNFYSFSKNKFFAAS